MSCTHTDDDPKCSSYNDKIKRATKLLYKAGKLEDYMDYTIDDAVRFGQHLVLKIAYSGKPGAILVFLNVTEVQVLRWRKIVPAFQTQDVNKPHEAPGASAMFPPTDAGWQEALNYARDKAVV